MFMNEIIIKRITAEQLRPLRQKLLRPNMDHEKLVYHGDEVTDTFHTGAFANGVLVGIATICRENKPNDNTPESWRLRGMAVENEYRRKKVGHKVLSSCIDHVKKQGGKHIWFNARLVAVEFYKSFDFKITSELFEIEDIGPHYNMEKFL